MLRSSLWCEPLRTRGLEYITLTHWGRVTHICVSRLTITGSENGLSPGRRQAIIWTNAGILLIGPLGTNFCGNLIEILAFSFKKMRLKVSSAKWRPFCLGLNVLTKKTHRLLGARLLYIHWSYHSLPLKQRRVLYRTCSIDINRIIWWL